MTWRFPFCWGQVLRLLATGSFFDLGAYRKRLTGSMGSALDFWRSIRGAAIARQSRGKEACAQGWRNVSSTEIRGLISSPILWRPNCARTWLGDLAAFSPGPPSLALSYWVPYQSVHFWRPWASDPDFQILARSPKPDTFLLSALSKSSLFGSLAFRARFPGSGQGSQTWHFPVECLIKVFTFWVPGLQSQIPRFWQDLTLSYSVSYKSLHFLTSWLPPRATHTWFIFFWHVCFFLHLLLLRRGEL